jgi:peptidoglycan hydrolase-like protein with peptidoglycan-binding domain
MLSKRAARSCGGSFESWEESVMKFLSLLLVTASEVLLTTGLMAQTIAPVGRPFVAGPVYHSSLGTTGLNAGVNQVPLTRSYASPAYDASQHLTINVNPAGAPTAPNPNRLAQPQKLVDPDRFVEKPNSAHRYNFQFSNNQIRSVQAALRRLGVYSGQVDGILGPDTRRAISDYQGRNRQPVTGQPDQTLNASLGIF